MIAPSLIDYCFRAASIGRWNDYPRTVPLMELDKQAHKFIIAYFLAKSEPISINFNHLIEAGIFEFLRRVVVTDIRPDVFHKALQKKSKQINEWVIIKLEDTLENIDNGKFFERFKCYLSDNSMWEKERFILKAASYLATRWEFAIIYQNSQFLSDIERVKASVEEELEDYYELIGVRKIALNKKLAHIVDLGGRLRFQKRWAQTPRVPETSVLGHMLIVALFSYFYSLKIDACNTRVQYNFFSALFHDLPEALTRDIISPVKYSVSGLDDIINEYEMGQIQDAILPYVPFKLQDEFSYLLGLHKGKKDEFTNRIYEKNINIVDTLATYNEDRFRAIDGVAIKQCDKLAAFIEATLSISHGVKSRELVDASKNIKENLKEKGNVNGINFYNLCEKIEGFYS